MSEQVSRRLEILARLERIPSSPWHVKARLIIGTATFFDGFDQILIAFALPVFIPMFHLTPVLVGFVISAQNVARLIGCNFFGWVGEKYGRKMALTIDIMIYAVSSLLVAFTMNYSYFVAVNVILGFGLGGEISLAGTYISEIAKAEGRGFFFIVYEYLLSIGLTGAALVGAFVIPYIPNGWRYMYVIAALPAFLVPLMRRSLPESPRWLADKMRLDEAERAVATIERSASNNGQKPLPPIDLTKVESARVIKKTSYRELFTGIYLRRTLTVWVIWFCAYFVSSAFITWLPSLYTFLFALSIAISIQYTTIQRIVGLLSGPGAAFFVDRIGRKGVFILSMGGGAVAFLFLWLTGAPTPIYVLVVGSIGALFIGLSNMVLLLYTPEVYPTRLRAIGAAAGCSVNYVANIVSPLAIAYILTVGGNIGNVFEMLFFVAVAGIIITATFAVETKKQVLETLSP